jgi:hypothetical protein
MRNHIRLIHKGVWFKDFRYLTWIYWKVRNLQRVNLKCYNSHESASKLCDGQLWNSFVSASRFFYETLRKTVNWTTSYRISKCEANTIIITSRFLRKKVLQPYNKEHGTGDIRENNICLLCKTMEICGRTSFKPVSLCACPNTATSLWRNQLLLSSFFLSLGPLSTYSFV